MQLYVELTPAGGILRPEPGRYSGPVVLTRPITIDGQGKVTIDGEGEGSIITIKSNDTILKGLHLTNSGESFDQADAGITLKADRSIIENNKLDHVLFGINVLGSNDAIIRNNIITSKDALPSQRGDGLRMWYSHDNLIENNKFIKVRDLYITNSLTNRFINNQISDSRIGFELIFSHENEIIGNSIKNNSSGLVLVYSNDLTIMQNHISHLRGFSGSAMALKECNSVKVIDNTILHCSTGISANAPLDPANALTIKHNQFVFNDIALYFYGEKGGHIIHENNFISNFIDVQASAPPASLYNNWLGNYWDRYAGFDLNNDSYGDTPYELYSWSDRLWVDIPKAQFFRGSTMLEVYDFIERLTHFSDPDLMVKDPNPRFKPFAKKINKLKVVGIELD
ncbi:MAG: nitrous oxide reductase family maturation protein NosD [Gammaproteobacteria bacterium]|nr:nitrous oxide reductase family maturation protein NosD [Gammaproteobacteria bacterium]